MFYAGNACRSHQWHLRDAWCASAGDHPTTQAVLDLLGAVPVRGKTVLDWGTGTGILGITALLRGAAQVLATETDLLAANEARANAELNGFGQDRFQVIPRGAT